MSKAIKTFFVTLGFLSLSIGISSWANTLADKLNAEAEAGAKAKSNGPLDINVIQPKKAKVGKKNKYRVEIRIGEKAEAVTLHVRPLDKSVKVFKASRPITKRGPFGTGSQTSFDFHLKTDNPGLQSVAVDVSLLHEGKESSRTVELKVDFVK